jgi:hypothetical protein
MLIALDEHADAVPTWREAKNMSHAHRSTVHDR